MGKRQVHCLFYSSFLFLFYSFSFVLAEEEKTNFQEKAQNLFQRIAGVPLLLGDPRLQKMAELISKNEWKEAAKVATDSNSFLSVTVRYLAAEMSNKEETPLVPFDDFQALVVGVVRDNMDARLLLTGNFRYQAKINPQVGFPMPSISNNEHYSQIEEKGISLKENLEIRVPQWDEGLENAGLLTTRAWAKAHMFDGTNRRPTEYAFREFLCAPLVTWKDAMRSDHRVRRDIDRKPSGKTENYLTECRGCHAAMDGFSGAWARLDFTNNALTFIRAPGVAQKMVRNSDVFPGGYETADNSWVNLAIESQDEFFGWRGGEEGVGVYEFGKALSNTKRFSQCFVERVFKKICRRDFTKLEHQTIKEKAAISFEENGYKLRDLFEEVAVLPECYPK